MNKLGLKLWSTNNFYKDTAIALFNEKLYSYIELTAVPGSSMNLKNLWAELPIPFIIHAPTSLMGLNLSKKELFLYNLSLIEEAITFADILTAPAIIVHPGIDGTLDETINQLQRMYDPRIVIENKPYYSIENNGKVCIGNHPEEIKKIVNQTGVRFCFDVSHAICAANALKKDISEFLSLFHSIAPSICHLSDGDWSGIIDQHLHFGEGSFDFSLILNYIPHNVPITVETKKNSTENLTDFIKDIHFLNQIMR